MISVIIPVYNTASYLKKCLDSIIEQSYSELEVILVDDGSTDESGSICDEYAGRDSRISVLHQKNQGVSMARNNALKMARGEWLSFVDSDDWLEPDMYSTMIDTADKTSADIIVCDLYDEREDGQVYRNIWKDILGKRELIFEDKDRFFYGFSFTPVLWNKLISKKLIGDDRFSQKCAYGEDTLFLANLAVRADRIAVDATPLYHYRSQREGNVVSARINPKMLDLLWASDKAAEKMVEAKAYEAAVHLIYVAFLQVIPKISVGKIKESEQYLTEVHCLTKKYKKYLSNLRHNPRTSRFRRILLYVALYSPKLSVILWNISRRLKSVSRHN